MLVLTLALASACVGSEEAPTAAPQAVVSRRGHTISFMFDDGYYGDLLASDVLGAYGFTATAYVITGQIGNTTPLHRLAWSDVRTLADAGWEIGSHTVHHLDASTAALHRASFYPPPCDAQTPTIDSELWCSREALRAHGFHPLGFAFPHGAYDADGMHAASAYYHYLRGFEDPGDPMDHMPPRPADAHNDFPFDRQGIRVVRVHYCDTEQTVMQRLCMAFYGSTTCGPGRPPGDRWVALSFHDIYESGVPRGCVDTPGEAGCACSNAIGANGGDHLYSWSSTQLADLAADVSTMMSTHPGVFQVANAIDVFGTTAGDSISPRGTERNPDAQMRFSESGDGSIAPYLAGRGTSASPDGLSGVFPMQGDFLASLSIAADGPAVRYVRSQPIAVSSHAEYIAETTLNVQELTAGVAGLYVDEYADAAGRKWISGRRIQDTCFPGTSCDRPAVPGWSIRTLNGVYSPSSSRVVSVRLQVYVEHGSGTVYADNVSLRSL